MKDFKMPHIAAAFPVFCQKILPLAFDNAESYLEFVAHINAKLNEVICAVNQQTVNFYELTKRIDVEFNAFKTEIENLIETNNEEIYQAIDDLEDALKEDINGLDGRLTDVEHDVESISGDIESIQGDIEDIQEDIENIESQLGGGSAGGGMSYFPADNFARQNYSVEMCAALVHVYYRQSGGDTWTPIADTTLSTIAYWCANVDPSDLGANDVLFIFDSFPLGENGQFITTGTYDENDFAQFYNIDSIPVESFNSGLTLCSTSTTSGAGSDVTITTTGTTTPEHYSALMISNTVAETMRQGAITQLYYMPYNSGQLYSRETGALVSPIIKIDNTLHYTDGVLGAVSPFERLTQSEWEAITPDPEKLYFVRGVNGDVNMYYGSLRMGAAYSAGSVSGSLANLGDTVIGDFQIIGG